MSRLNTKLHDPECSILTERLRACWRWLRSIRAGRGRSAHREGKTSQKDDKAVPKVVIYLLFALFREQVHDQVIRAGDSHRGRDALKRSQYEESILVIH